MHIYVYTCTCVIMIRHGLLRINKLIMKITHMLFLDLNNSFVIYPCDILIAKKITHGPWLTWVGKENTIKEGG